MTTKLEARDARTVARALAILERAFSHPDRPTLDNPNTAQEYAQLRLGGLDREQMIALWLDSQHRLIQVEILSTGTITQTTVYPREVVRSALQFGACSVIFAHNHPSGNSTPSGADISLTKTLKAALSLVDVKTLDHLIVTASHARSLAAMGEI
jgi:DNA repair protein RadC